MALNTGGSKGDLFPTGGMATSGTGKRPKALTYTTNQKEYLETFMEVKRLLISNNLCESNINSFVTARRAWLFADTPRGTKANAILYTLVERARLNALDVFAYLKYLLTEMPNNHHPDHPEIIENYLPWSATLLQKCKLNYKNKKYLKL